MVCPAIIKNPFFHILPRAAYLLIKLEGKSDETRCGLAVHEVIGSGLLDPEDDGTTFLRNVRN